MVAEDPVVARRQRIARFAALGKRIGYLALGVAIVAFFIGVATVVPDVDGRQCRSRASRCRASCSRSRSCSAYGVRAAAREDRERGV